MTLDPSYTQEGIRQLVDAVFRKVDRANVDQAATHVVGIQGIRCRRALVRHRMICTGVWNVDPQGGRDFADHLSDHLSTKLLAEGFVVDGWRRDYTAEEVLGLDHEIHTFSAHRAQGDWQVELERRERPAMDSIPAGVIVDLAVDRAE